MNFKTCTLSLAALLLATSAFAQDEIHKRRGGVIEGKVIEVGTKTISYKKASNPDGPSYVIDKADVSKIEYENGNVEEISAGPRGPMGPREMMGGNISESNKDYGNNIIALSPMQITDKGLGVALSYERVLDKKRNLVSFYMPVAVSFNSFDNSNGNNYSHLFFMPGIKFYPTGGKGVVRYGIGTNLCYATGRRDVVTTLPVPGPGPIVSQYTTEDYNRFGMMIFNSLNINPTAHLHMGLEFGFGFTYTDNIDDFNSPDPFNFAQFGFKIGYRF